MPAPPPRMMRDEPTGEVRFRKGLFGKLILQVELCSRKDDALGGNVLYWVDAIESDIWRLRWHRAHNKLEPLL